jgi:hypothetical protein
MNKAFPRHDKKKQMRDAPIVICSLLGRAHVSLGWILSDLTLLAMRKLTTAQQHTH